MKLILAVIFTIITLFGLIAIFKVNENVQAQENRFNTITECEAACTGICEHVFVRDPKFVCQNPRHNGCSNTYCDNQPSNSSYVACRQTSPTPTTPPSCGGPCVPNQTQCPIECPRCVDANGTGQPTCRVVITQPPQPSNTPRPTTPPKSPTPKATATPRPTSTPKPTATPRPTNTPTPIPSNTPSPSPTPFPFSDAMCKCDGIEIGQVAAGQDLTVTAYGKVEGEDTRYAKITSFSFFVAKGDSGSSDITIFNRSGPVASEIVSTSQNLVRNKASWTFKFPGNPEVGKEYRIWNQLKCERNTAGVQIASSGKSQKVLAEATENQSFVQRFLNFILGIFGQGQKPEAKPTGFLVTTQSDDNDQLQLGTFKFGRIIPDPATACYMVKIQFDN